MISSMRATMLSPECLATHLIKARNCQRNRQSYQTKAIIQPI